MLGIYLLHKSLSLSYVYGVLNRRIPFKLKRERNVMRIRHLFFFFSSTFLSSTAEITTRLWRNVVGAHLLAHRLYKVKAGNKKLLGKTGGKRNGRRLLQSQL